MTFSCKICNRFTTVMVEAYLDHMNTHKASQGFKCACPFFGCAVSSSFIKYVRTLVMHFHAKDKESRDLITENEGMYIDRREL